MNPKEQTVVEDDAAEMHARIERVLGKCPYPRDSQDYAHWLRLGHLVLESWANSRASLLGRTVNAKPEDVSKIAVDALVTQFDLAGSLVTVTTTGYASVPERERRLEQCADRAFEWFKEQVGQQPRWIRESISFPEAKLRLQQRVAHWTAQCLQIAREAMENKAALVPADRGSPEPTNATVPQFTKRATWLRDQLDSRGWTPHDVERSNGPNWRTVRKILEGKQVQATVLEKLVQALSVKKSKVRLSDIPSD